jgi:hypothetical protein
LSSFIEPRIGERPTDADEGLSSLRHLLAGPPSASNVISSLAPCASGGALSHRIHILRRCTHGGARLNLQPVRGEAKPYQIRQLLGLVEKYHSEPEE